LFNEPAEKLNASTLLDSFEKERPDDKGLVSVGGILATRLEGVEPGLVSVVSLDAFLVSVEITAGLSELEADGVENAAPEIPSEDAVVLGFSVRVVAGLAEVAGENAEMVVWEGAGENAGWEVAGENADLEDPDPKPSPCFPSVPVCGLPVVLSSGFNPKLKLGELIAAAEPPPAPKPAEPAPAPKVDETPPAPKVDETPPAPKVDEPPPAPKVEGPPAAKPDKEVGTLPKPSPNFSEESSFVSVSSKSVFWTPEGLTVFPKLNAAFSVSLDFCSAARTCSNSLALDIAGSSGDCRKAEVTGLSYFFGLTTEIVFFSKSFRRAASLSGVSVLTGDLTEGLFEEVGVLGAAVVEISGVDASLDLSLKDSASFLISDSLVDSSLSRPLTTGEL